MRIDLPTCGFKSCRYCFDGNCTKKVEYMIGVSIVNTKNLYKRMDIG